MSTSRLIRLAVCLVMLVLVGSACQQNSEPNNSEGAPVSCQAPTTSQEVVGGPLKPPSGALTSEKRYPPGSLQDAYIIQLVDSGSEPITICSVKMVAQPGFAKLRYKGAFVAPDTAELRMVTAGRHQGQLQSATGYCLEPTPMLTDQATGEQELDVNAAPILVLRIGPALSGQRSMNNAVNVHYRTADGTRYVTAYAFRFDYAGSSLSQ